MFDSTRIAPADQKAGAEGAVLGTAGNSEKGLRPADAFLLLGPSAFPFSVRPPS
jgi:hypothetical protein